MYQTFDDTYPAKWLATLRPSGLDIEVDMSELKEFAEGTEKQLRQIGDEIRKEYLQHFTRPIWEREEHEENG